MGDASSARPAQKRARDGASVRLSKAMSKVLRHNPPATIDASGWVPLADLMSSLKQKPDLNSIKSVVSSDEKGRFQLDEEHEPPRIRATQGHSVKLDAPLLTPVQSADEVATAIHVTSQEVWNSIQTDGFLRRMKRTHIHFATSPDLARKNCWATCFLKLDVARALKDGIPLYLSSNGVLLCEGPLSVEYVEVIDGFSK